MDTSQLPKSLPDPDEPQILELEQIITKNPKVGELVEKAKAIPLDTFDTQEKITTFQQLLHSNIPVLYAGFPENIFDKTIDLALAGFTLSESPLAYMNINDFDNSKEREGSRIKNISNYLCFELELIEHPFLHAAIELTHHYFCSPLRLSSVNEGAKYKFDAPQFLKEMPYLWSTLFHSNGVLSSHKGLGELLWNYQQKAACSGDFNSIVQMSQRLPSLLEKMGTDENIHRLSKLFNIFPLASRNTSIDKLIFDYPKLVLTAEKKGILELYDYTLDTLLLLAQKKKENKNDKESKSVILLRNLDFLTKNSFFETIKSYESFGLIGRYKEIVDLTLPHYSMKSFGLMMHPLKSHKLPTKDFMFEFLENFPRLYSKHGKKITHAYTSLYRIFGESLYLGCFEESINDFQNNHFDVTLGYEAWFSYLQSIKDEARIFYGPELVFDSLDAIKKGINLTHYQNHIEHIVKHTLFNMSEKFATVLGEDINPTWFSYYSQLHHLKNFPDMTSDWMDALSSYFSIGKDELTVWLDKLTDYKNKSTFSPDSKISSEERDLLSKKLFSYTSSLQQMIDFSVDFVELLEVIEYIPQNINFTQLTLSETFQSLDFNQKITFLKKLEGHEHLIGFLQEDFDLQKAQQRHSHFLDQVPCEEETRRLLSGLSLSEQLITDIKLLSSDAMTSIFRPGDIFYSSSVSTLDKNISFADAVNYLIIGLTTKNENSFSQAEAVLATGKLASARSYISTTHLPPSKLYDEISFEYHKFSMAEDSYRKESRGWKLISSLKDFYLNKNNNHQQSDDKDSLRELIWAVETSGAREQFDTVIVKMQDRSADDLIGGKRLLCCTMLDDDYGKHSLESLYYSLDPYLGIIHVTPYQGSDPLKPIGAVIVANATCQNTSVLLIDSVEGGSLYDTVSKTHTPVLHGIYSAAEKYNFGSVFFNKNVGGDRPKAFNIFLESLGLQPETQLLNVPGRDKQPTTQMYRHLEAFEDKIQLSGPATGYMVSTKQLGGLLAT